MSKYHKIQSIYKRYDKGENKGKFRVGEYSRPEFENLFYAKWYIEEKLDGMNTRIILKKFKEESEIPEKWLRLDSINDIKDGIKFGLFMSGKTDKAEIPDGIFDYCNYKFDIGNVIKVFPFFLEKDEVDVITLYGEGIGEKIQKGGKYVNDSFEGFKNKFVLFDVKIQNTYLSKREDVSNLANELNVDMVPFIARQDLLTVIDLCKNGFSSVYGDFEAEGVVARFNPDLYNVKGERILTKCKVKDFR